MLQYCPADITEKFGKESFGMKKKYIGTVFFSLLLLLLFLPVFFYVVNSNPRIPFVTQDSLFVNENPVL